MKTKLCWSSLSIVATGIIVVGVEYIAKLNDRTQGLEARLARVEADLNSTRVARAQVVTVRSPSTQPAVPKFHYGLGSPGGVSHETLESRVEKIERELKPHLELLAYPTSDAPAGNVSGTFLDIGVKDPPRK